VGRRVFLGLFGLGALGIVTGTRAQTAVTSLLAPIQLRDPTGLTSLLPVGDTFRYYSVTGGVPTRDATSYRLAVSGLVDRPTTFTLADLQAMRQTHLVRDFQCVTGWRVEGVDWAGVRLRDVLVEAGVQPAATHVLFHSFDGSYSESLSLDQARRDDVLVAHTLQGDPLSRDHGGPVRLYVAPMYGYKSLKWLDRIELVNGLPDDEAGYWEQRGYDTDGWVGHSNGGHEDQT
jgi:DMSO/TMAO reductase YedYZ molybdopterin-dependent catalytic subunit